MSMNRRKEKYTLTFTYEQIDALAQAATLMWLASEGDMEGVKLYLKGDDASINNYIRMVANDACSGANIISDAIKEAQKRDPAYQDFAHAVKMRQKHGDNFDREAFMKALRGLNEDFNEE